MVVSVCLIPVEIPPNTGIFDTYLRGHPMSEVDRLKELADFLKARRAIVNPTQIGLTKGKRRKVAGLRREEVAEMAGISVTWYTWLEQARPVNVSVRTAEAISEALRLREDERAYLFDLCKLAAPEKHEEVDDNLADLQAMVDAFGDMPAYLLNARWDVLYWNKTAGALFNFDQHGPKVNLVKLLLLDDYMHTLSINWQADAQSMLAHFRTDYTRNLSHVHDFEELIAELDEKSPEFRQWWPMHQVLRRSGWLKEMKHPDPEIGSLKLRSMVLERSNLPYPRLVAYNPVDARDWQAKVPLLLAAAKVFDPVS